MSNDDHPRSGAGRKLRRRRRTSVWPKGIRRRARRLFLDRKKLGRALQYVHERPFGLETAEHVYHEDLGLPPADDVVWHIPSDWVGLRRALRRLRPSGSDIFLDVGSGLGRAVIVAARFPFGRVVGVELSEELNQRARANVERAKASLRCQDVQLVTADATGWQIPSDVTVVYFYSPFTGRVFDRVVRNLLASVDDAPRLLRLLYNVPVEHSRLLRTGRARVIDACPSTWPASGDVIVTYQLLPRDGRTAEALAQKLPDRVPRKFKAWRGEYEPGYLIYKPARLGGIAVYRPRSDPTESPSTSDSPGAGT